MKAHSTESVDWEQNGEGGIRTPGAFQHTRLPSVHHRPLGHLSKGVITADETKKIAKLSEREGFEPSVPSDGTTDFESVSFDHSDISPGDYDRYT